MNNKISEFFKKKPIRSLLPIICSILIILSSMFLLWQSNAKSNQSMPAYLANVYFLGEYRIDKGEWQDVVKGEHIPATKGDVTLRGNFHMLTPDGEYVGVYRDELPIAFYLDHISLTIYEANSQPFTLDMENPMYRDSLCGVNWEAYNLTSGKDDLIEILIKNYHSYGNENAIDEMLSKITLWMPIEFEKSVLDSGATQRNIGLAIIIASVMFLGTALFSSLIHVKNSKLIWLLGLVILFAGIYFTYSSFGISFWSESIVLNTSILGISMILYSFFLSALVTSSFKKTKTFGVVICSVLGFLDVILTFFSSVANVV
jgi:hypothetical protein